MCASLALFGLLAGLANAQSASFHGPIAGFVFNRGSRTIQPLLGVPGATYSGSPVLNDVDAASVAPGGRWALIVRSGLCTFVRGLSDPTPSESSPEGLLNMADRIVWSSSGSHALLYSSSKSQLQRIHVSHDEVAADPPVDLSSWGAGQITTLAIDPAGRQIAFGVAGAGLFFSAPDSSPVLLSSMMRPAAATFDETGNRLYAVDLDQQRILEFDSASAGFEFTSLAHADQSPLNPVGMAVSRDARYLLLTDSATRAVLVYETETHNLVNSIALDFAPSRMEPLSSDSYLLNGDNNREWLLVLDARQTPAVYFVPAGGKELL